MIYIEPHAHMVSRTTNDYQAIAQAGCQALCEPAFWAGYDRGSVEGFRDYFRQLTEYEPARAAKFGIPHFTWLCINPKEADDVVFGREVLAMIPDFLDQPHERPIDPPGDILFQVHRTDRLLELRKCQFGPWLGRPVLCIHGTSFPVASPLARHGVA